MGTPNEDHLTVQPSSIGLAMLARHVGVFGLSLSFSTLRQVFQMEVILLGVSNSNNWKNRVKFVHVTRVSKGFKIKILWH